MTESKHRPKILIVDDKMENLVALTKTLSKVDCEVVTASSGNEALALILSHQFAVFLLDVQMPQMDGYELAELIRGYPGTRNVPIIFLTANYKSKSAVSKGYQTGAIDYLCKPIDSKILISKLAFFLDLHKEQSKNLDLIEMLTKARERLEQTNRELSEYAYLVSHDLKEPLRHINSTAEILLEDYHDLLESKITERLKLITKLCEKMAELIQATLDFAKVDHVQPQKQPTDMNSLIENVIDLIDTTHEDRSKVQIRDSLPTIKCDSSRMQQVFLNLISNGLRYNRSEEKRVTIEWDPDEEYFIVEDNGIGIDREYHEDIFKMCRRINADDDFGPGAGIGLALARKLIEQQGGKINVSSELGRGSKFYVNFPLKES